MACQIGAELHCQHALPEFIVIYSLLQEIFNIFDCSDDGKANIIKSLLFLKMVFPSSILCTPVEILSDFVFYATEKTKLFVSQLPRTL